MFQIDRLRELVARNLDTDFLLLEALVAQIDVCVRFGRQFVVYQVVTLILTGEQDRVVSLVDCYQWGIHFVSIAASVMENLLSKTKVVVVRVE